MRCCSSIVVLNVENPSLCSAPGLPRVVDEAYRWYRQGKPVVVALTFLTEAADTGASKAGAARLQELLDRCGIPAATLYCAEERHYGEVLEALDSFPVVIVHGLKKKDATALGAALCSPSFADRAGQTDAAFAHGAFAQINLVSSAGSAEYGDSPTRLRVGLLGLGTVGRGVFQSLSLYPERFEITGIAVRDTGRPERLPLLRKGLLGNDPWRVIESDADVVIELIGGHEPALALISEALRRGKQVVTANKLVIARHGAELIRLAERHRGSLFFAAAVGGAVPMLETVNRTGGAGPIESLKGVLNGTCNFVLDELARGSGFQDAVAKAQTLGFAEADPTLDLDGTDAAHKLTLLARACGAELKLENIDRSGILGFDARRVHSLAAGGKSVRLVAGFSRGTSTSDARELCARVAPEVVDAEHPFARIRGEQNCLIARRADGSEQVLRGKGAGRWPTTVSVMSDVLAISRSDSWLRFNKPAAFAAPGETFQHGGAA